MPQTKRGSGFDPDAEVSRAKPPRPQGAPLAEPRDVDRTLVQSLSKGLRILGMFGAVWPEASVKEIAQYTGLPQPTVYRLVKTLEDDLYLVFSSDTGKYRPGPAMIPALYLLEGRSSLVGLLHGHLQALADAAEEHASLAVEVGTAAVLIDSAESSRNPWRLNLAVGRVHMDLASAHQKVFAAFREPESLPNRMMPDDSADEAHAVGAQLHQSEFANELARIRGGDVALDLEEFSSGVCAVARPVRDGSKAVVASIALVVLKERFDGDRRARLTELVKTCSKSMSRELGYLGE